MAKLNEMSALDLSALLASRICHDLISPIGSVVNGLELMEEETEEGMRDSALQLVRQSAIRAASGLLFARYAFGAIGSTGTIVSLSDIKKVLCDYMVSVKAELNWQIEEDSLEKDWVKLLLNIAQMAIDCVPRGGEVQIQLQTENGTNEIVIISTGEKALLPENIRKIIIEGGDGYHDATFAQPIYSWHLARVCGVSINITTGAEHVEFRTSKI